MFQVLVVAIGVLVLAGLLMAARSRSRFGGGDPSSSVQAFNRALSAMEPGARDRSAQQPGHSGAEGEHPPRQAPPEDAAGEDGGCEVASRDDPSREGTPRSV